PGRSSWCLTSCAPPSEGLLRLCMHARTAGGDPALPSVRRTRADPPRNCPAVGADLRAAPPRVSIFRRCSSIAIFPGAIKIVVQISAMDYSPFLKEILTRLLTPRLTLSAPPPQKELIDKLLSVSDDELTNRSGAHANCVRSLLLLQAGEFDRSHSIVQ